MADHKLLSPSRLKEITERVRLTKMQRRVLERMAAGETLRLFPGDWNGAEPTRFGFKGDDFISKRVWKPIVYNGLIKFPTLDCELTPAGRELLKKGKGE